jgi:flagellar hook-associated protein 1
MAGLTSALSTALSGLVTTQSQTAVVSRNITRASEENYTRKQVDLTTDFAGNARIANIVRVVEQRLGAAVGSAFSTAEGQRITSEALARLAETVGDVEDDGSIAWGIARLQTAIADYEATPSNISLANAAVRIAADLASALNVAASAISSVRQDADTGIANSVSESNRLLAEIEELNTKITRGGSDSGMIAELLDKRDAAIRSLSAEMGLRTIERPNRGIAIYTDSGATLFDISARTVSFATSIALPSNGNGNAVYVDGIQVSGSGSPMPLRQGRIAAQVEVRDGHSRIFEIQTDEIARSLIAQFAESDQGIPASLPAATGLFRYAGSPAVPTIGVLHPGIASQIKINPLFDSSQGGSAEFLRDGGANGASYSYNPAGTSGYQQRLTNLIAGLERDVGFDPSSGLPTSTNLKSYASLSAGWIEQRRAENANRLISADASLQRVTEAFNKKSGVNIDEEMATLLNLEKSYQASAKIISTVDQMLSTLMQIVR